MNLFVRLFVVVAGLFCLMLLVSCGAGSGSVSGSSGIYGVYGHPHYYNSSHQHNYYRPNVPDRPDRPGRPETPIVRPRPDNPSIQPVNRPRPANMGRPARSSGGRR